MGSYLEALKSREAKITAEGSSDKRKQRGGHSYSLVVLDCFAMINNLLSRGDTILGIFNHFRDGGIFDENAEYKHFYNALQRECKKRGVRIHKNLKSKKSAQPIRHHAPVIHGGDGENSIKPKRDREDF